MHIPPVPGRLGLFTVGMGAVATTLMAGVEFSRRGLREPIGAFTQTGWITDKNGERRRVVDAFGFGDLGRVIFGGVDLIENNAFDAARTAGVLSAEDLALVGDYLATVKAGPGVHDAIYVRTLETMQTLPETNKHAQAEAMTRVFKKFFAEEACESGVVLLTLSTEAWRPLAKCHQDEVAFIAGLKANDPEISPSQIYAWAAFEAGYPVINCTPNVVLEVPALQARAAARGVAFAGSDLKSGQTLMKTVVAGGLAKRLLGVNGWFSTNILGNRDGFVLDVPENFRAKEISKGGVLEDIFDAKEQPALYKDLVHQIHINYFPPKGDNKESWDSIQLFGWLGYAMEIKINFQCRDSILAAPLVLDLALLMDLAARKGETGIQSWLGGYFKSPAARTGEAVINDFSLQIEVIQNKLRGWL